MNWIIVGAVVLSQIIFLVSLILAMRAQSHLNRVQHEAWKRNSALILDLHRQCLLLAQAIKDVRARVEALER